VEALEGRDVPSTLTVATNADSGAGALRTEINLANNGDTIVFAPSMAGKTITEIYGEMSIRKSLTIQGLGANELTVTGEGFRLFEVLPSANVTVSGLSVEGGSASNGSQDHGGEGGGFLNLGTLTLSGCTVRYNKGSVGGGIYNAGTLTLNGCTVSKNLANEGGGIYNAASATLTISQSTLSTDRAAGEGGAICNAGTLTVSSSTLSGDSASFEGGGSGGGIYNSGKATVSGCSLSGDSAGYHGGGIYNAGALTVLDSIFSSNTPDDIYGSFTDGGGNTFQ
jgi:hypothetical protein